MKPAVLICLTCLVAVSVAWTITPRDRRERERLSDQIAHEKLDLWKKAVANNDKSTLRSILTEDIIEWIHYVDKDNQILDKGLGPLMMVMNHLAHPTSILLKPLSFVRQRALSLLTHQLDRFQKVPYYSRLDGVRKWIELRTQRDSVQNMEEFDKAHAAVVDARDAFERMETTFGAGLEDLKAETSSIFHADAKKMSEVAKNMIRVVNGNKKILVEETREAKELLQAAAHKLYDDAETDYEEPADLE